MNCIVKKKLIFSNKNTNKIKMLCIFTLIKTNVGNLVLNILAPKTFVFTFKQTKNYITGFPIKDNIHYLN